MQPKWVFLFAAFVDILYDFGYTICPSVIQSSQGLSGGPVAICEEAFRQ
jgi:hypothetical protein